MTSEQPYQVMPDLSEEEYADLKADIAERGVMVPIELDENGNVLDGHHRLRACKELGITDYPATIRGGMTEDEKLLHALTLNTARRHLSREQKAEAITKLLEQNPQLSDRQIARAVGVSHPTVGKYRRQLSGEAEVVKVTTQEKDAMHKVYPDANGTFTCCICGKDVPAHYETVGGEPYNMWGYDPWPIREDGDCCRECWGEVNEIVNRLPRETQYRHYFGPHWRDVANAYEAMADEDYAANGDYFPRRTPDEEVAELKRRLKDAGVEDMWMYRYQHP